MLFIHQEIIIYRLRAHNKQMVAGQILSVLSLLLGREESSSVGKKNKSVRDGSVQLKILLHRFNSPHGPPVSWTNHRAILTATQEVALNSVIPPNASPSAKIKSQMSDINKIKDSCDNIHNVQIKIIPFPS